MIQIGDGKSLNDRARECFSLPKKGTIEERNEELPRVLSDSINIGSSGEAEVLSRMEMNEMIGKCMSNNSEPSANELRSKRFLKSAQHFSDLGDMVKSSKLVGYSESVLDTKSPDYKLSKDLADNLFSYDYYLAGSMLGNPGMQRLVALLGAAGVI
jgi:hypothetical protein